MKNKVLTSIAILITIVVCIMGYKYVKPEPEWVNNSESFKETALSLVDVTTPSVFLSDITSFDWDTVYSFAPYSSKEMIYSIVGYKWADIDETVSEGMDQIVFMNKGSVVCYIYGYPSNNHIGFDFGDYNKSYIELKRIENPKFSVEANGDILYFVLEN